MTIDVQKKVYFYDDRGKHNHLLVVTEVLYSDAEIGLCVAQPIGSTDASERVKLLFDRESRQVQNSEYDCWLTTNDEKWALAENERLRERHVLMGQ